MKKFILASLLLLSAAPAQAAEKRPELDPNVCRQMVEYQPDPDVSADYQPGVDVHGKPVVEADANPGPEIKMPEEFSFDLTVDAARYMGFHPLGMEGQATVGTVTVKKDGVYYNGQPLDGASVQALRELCAPQPKPLQK